jgi:two-component system, NarL family, sensor histidine kinase DevS
MPATEAERLRRLLETGIAINSELSLDAVLQRIVEAAAHVTSARYAALGVIDQSGRYLERFITHGVDAGTHEAIGHPPRGLGILGVLIHDEQTLRLHDLTEDPRSVGFPPNHPPMRTFLGTSIRLRGVAYGNLYLSQKEDGSDFDEGDEELVTLLAAQAAVAIENARLYESATAWSRQMQSLQEIGTAMAGELDLPPLLQLVTERLRELVDARVVAVALPVPSGELRIEAVAGENAEALLHTTLPRESKVARVRERGRSERVDSVLDDREVLQEVARRLGATSGLYVPLMVRDEAIGVVFAHDKAGPDVRFSSADQRLVELFAGRAAVAVDLSHRLARDSLRRLVEGQEQERRRLARELHDETGQALTSVLLGLKAVEEAKDEAQLRSATGKLRELVVATLQDVRRLAVELRPKALDDFGLVPAVERLVQTFGEATGVEVQLEARLSAERLPAVVETTLYRTVQEGLTNIAKHAGAHRVSVLLMRRDGAVTVVIEDDGQGFAAEDVEAGDGMGLDAMRERVALLDGRLAIESAPGGGTTLVVEVPAT